MSNYLFKSRSYALISVLLFSSITNSYLYINHILPYDLSLLIIYSILTYIVINFNHLNKFKHLVIGILSFLGFITYPGYLPFLMIIGFYILFNKIKHQVYNNCFNALFFIIGLIIALVFTQILSIIGGHNYIIDSMNFSETITFGSYEESYSFIFKYLFEVEKIVGSIIVMLLAFHIYLVIKIKPEINSYYVLIIGVLSIYLFYASLGFFFHRFVQYGRLIHQYIPFVVVISIYSITKINIPKKTTFLLVLSSFIFIGYFYNFISLYKMGYPRDIAWKYSKKYDFNNIIINNEFMNILPNYPLKQYPFEEIGRYTEFTFPHTSKDSIVLVNFCHIFPPKNKEEISLYISNNYKEIVNTKHFLSHIAYQFEGANIDQRKKVQKFSQFYKIKLYAK